MSDNSMNTPVGGCLFAYGYSMHKSKPISPCRGGWKAGEGVPGESSRSRCRKPLPLLPVSGLFPCAGNGLKMAHALRSPGNGL